MKTWWCFKKMNEETSLYWYVVILVGVVAIALLIILLLGIYSHKDDVNDNNKASIILENLQSRNNV